MLVVEMNEKKVYLYNLDGDLIEEFKNTQECADYFGYDREYIYHNLKYYKKIRKDGKWYKIKRTKEDTKGPFEEMDKLVDLFFGEMAEDIINASKKGVDKE